MKKRKAKHAFLKDRRTVFSDRRFFIHTGKFKLPANGADRNSLIDVMHIHG